MCKLYEKEAHFYRTCYSCWKLVHSGNYSIDVTASISVFLLEGLSARVVMSSEVSHKNKTTE